MNLSWQNVLTFWGIIGPVGGYLIGFRRDIKVSDREHYRSLYGGLLDIMTTLEDGLKQTWFVPKDGFGLLQEFAKKRQTDFLISAAREKIKTLLQELQQLQDADDGFLATVRASVDQVNGRLAPIRVAAAGSPDPLRVPWPKVLDVNSPPLTGVAGQRNIVIELPAGPFEFQTIRSCKNVNVFADALKVGWHDFFGELSKVLSANESVRSYSDLRARALVVIEGLANECRRRRVEPFTFWEYHNPTPEKVDSSRI